MTGNIVRRAAATTVLAAGILAALTGTAQASPDTAAVKPSAQLGPITTLPIGTQQFYSTWFWGSTRLCATNKGGETGELTVQSTSPAASPEYVYIDKGRTKCIDRWWFGVPVWAINSGNVTLEVSAS